MAVKQALLNATFGLRALDFGCKVRVTCICRSLGFVGLEAEMVKVHEGGGPNCLPNCRSTEDMALN